MGENEATIMEEIREPSPEEIQIWDEERKKNREAELAAAKAAAEMRKSTAKIIAEHDDILAEVLFELTLKDIEEE